MLSMDKMESLNRMHDSMKGLTMAKFQCGVAPPSRNALLRWRCEWKHTQPHRDTLQRSVRQPDSSLKKYIIANIAITTLLFQISEEILQVG